MTNSDGELTRVGSLKVENSWREGGAPSSMKMGTTLSPWRYDAAADQASDRYEPARRFLESCATGPELLCLAWPTWMSYLRIATQPRIFSSPLSPDEAVKNISALIELPHVRAVSELDGFMDAYRHVAGEAPVRGNLVPDAHVAAILFHHGVGTLYTNDRDFRKFQSLDVREPFT